MLRNKYRLTAIFFLLAMIGTFFACSNRDTNKVKSTEYTLSDNDFNKKHEEIHKKIKDCIGIEDIRIIKTKSFDVLSAWIKSEIDTTHRNATLRYNKETDVYIGMSLPKINENHQALFGKLQNCIEAEDVGIIETRDDEVIDLWIKTEGEEYKKKYDEKKYDLYISINQVETSIKTGEKSVREVVSSVKEKK